MVNVNIEFDYDDDSESFIFNNKNSFEQIIISGINQFFRDHKEFITSDKINILIQISSKEAVSMFCCKYENANSFTILLNLIELRNSGFDINKYIQYKVPLPMWFIFRKWYGKKSTFLDMLEHEIRHYIDRDKKDMEQYIQKLIESGKKGVGIELNRAIQQIRNEAYTGLFDSKSDIEFSHTRLFRIKYSIQLYIRSHGEQLPSDFEERRGWFLGLLAPGDHHYYLAKYMAYIIAYSLMNPNTILNERSDLKVKDMNKIINEGTTINQPSIDAKKKAGELIISSDPLNFLQLFEDACNKLRISQRNIPLNYSIFKEIEAESFEHQKMIEDERYQELINKWKQKKITFFQLKKMIKERGQT